MLVEPYRKAAVLRLRPVWTYYQSDAFTETFLGTVPGDWVHVFDTGRFEAGEVFDKVNTVSVGQCQLIPEQ